MAIYNKITLNGTTLIDLSTDTVAVADDIASGKVGHLNTGATATGTHSGGSGGFATDDVRFIDYDGTILYSYSAQDFAALSAMPANPTHTGLTSQGWNWTLADAKAQVTAMGNCDIGQMYVTDDGKTRVYISLVDSARLSPYLGICPNGTVRVDWGDGTATDTLTGTSLTAVKRAQHSYATTGDYIITLTVSSGSFAIYGTSSSTNGSYLLTRTDGNIISQRVYQNAIQKVELGANVSLGIYAFQHCSSLASITIPNTVTSIGKEAFTQCYPLFSVTIPSGVTSIESDLFRACYSLVNVSIPCSVTSIGNNAFYYCKSLERVAIPNSVTEINVQPFMYCFSLKSLTLPSGITSVGQSLCGSCSSLIRVSIPNSLTSYGYAAFSGCSSLVSITIPSGVTSIGNNAFSSCESLANINIPSNVTKIGSSAFNNCYSLGSITIPSSVTSIGSNAFYYCNSVAEYHLLPTTPPTLANTNAFSGIPDDCKIYVPSASLSAYQTATNWSTYASKMVGE